MTPHDHLLPGTDLRCPHCGQSAAAHGRAFRDAQHVAQHAIRCRANPHRIAGRAHQPRLRDADGREYIVCRTCHRIAYEADLYRDDWRRNRRECKNCQNDRNTRWQASQRGTFAQSPAATPAPAPVVVIGILLAQTVYTCACGRGFDTLPMWRQHTHAPDASAACRASLRAFLAQDAAARWQRQSAPRQDQPCREH
jgi:hypothetical protein